jgi:hypothetical protein
MVDIEKNAQQFEKNRPVGVRFNDGMVWATLADGRVIGNPLDWHPWLKQARPEQLTNIEMDVFSLFWPDLGEGLDIEGMLEGIQPVFDETQQTQAQQTE